ncbi:MAG: hypothetical protein WCC74_01740 [Minisyncoccia bacterium]
MFKKIIKFFDKLEDRVRARLSHRSIFYALVGALLTVLFWRGVWHTADILKAKGGVWYFIFYEPNTIIWTSILLLMTGLFVSLFIGDRIIISGIKSEKKIDEKTEEELRIEGGELKQIILQIDYLQKEMQEIKEMFRKKG